MIGFCHLGSICINDELMRCERGEGSHPPVLWVIMVSGLFFKFDFPLALFSTEVSLVTCYIPCIVWEGILITESTGLKVITITADGARELFWRHGNGTVHKAKNVYASDERFFSDSPHLINTMHNSWS